MPNPTEGCFIGTMPVQTFLDNFLEDGQDFTPTPQADFSKVAPETDSANTHDMCTPLIRAVKKSKLLPGLRLFVARAKRRWGEGGLRTQRGGQEELRKTKDISDLCPTMSIRKEPSSRGHKKSTTMAEYYNFATSLLGIEVRHRPDDDPFADREDYESSSGSPAASPGSLSHSPPHNKSRTVLKSPVSVPQDPRKGSSPFNIPGVIPSESDQEGRTPDQQNSPRPVSQSSSTGSFRQPVERETEEGKAFRRSLVSHAHAQLARQHRTFFFQIILVNRWARFVRWDRSGAVVSSRFDYVLEPRFLCEFLWRFAHVSNIGRGLDPTVTPANKSEIRLFEAVVQDFLNDMKAGSKDGRLVRHLPGAEGTLDSSETYPTWKIRVTNEESGSNSDLVVRRPFASHSSLLGRATRAYVAYDLQEQRLVFMKDAWRIDHPKLQAEFTTYQHLKEHGVPHIPAILYGGDVLTQPETPQRTLSQVYASSGESWCRTDGSFERYIHHRLVQDIAYPLECALDEREFIQAIYNGLRAIASAFDIAGLLHRDLSLGNIMLDSLGRGILNDWDHAGGKDSRARGIGTWRFMSLCLLEHPTKIHGITDDLESVFWVLLYGALKRFVQSNQDRLIRDFDYQVTDLQNGRQIGGQLKEGCIFGHRLQKVAFTSDCLQELIQKSRRTWFGYYTVLQDKDTMGLDAHPEVKAKMMEEYEHAKQPAFWVDLFAKALDDYDAKHPPAQRTSSGNVELSDLDATSQISKHGTKRKAGDDEVEQGPFEDTNGEVPLRRSKRLKLSRG